MSREGIQELLRRYFEDFWDRRQFELADELFSESFVFHAPIVPEGIRGAGEYRDRVIAPLIEAFPDIRFTPSDYLIDGDAVAVPFSMEGTHRGTFEGIKATGRRFSVPGIVFAHVSQGRIQDIRGVFDGLLMLQQFGVVPTPG